MNKPLLVMAILDAVPRCIDWTDKEIHELCYQAGSVGVDYFRLMYWPIPEYPQPYMETANGFDLGTFNLTWWKQLQRFRRIANQWKIGIYFDLFDHCGTKKGAVEYNPWYNNIQGVKEIYDTSPRALHLYKKWTSKVIRDVRLRGWWVNRLGLKIPVRLNLFGLGNELTLRVNREGLHSWAHNWGYGLAEHLRSLGYQGKILWSGEEKTAHALRAYISPENQHVKSIIGYGDTVIQYHGMDYRMNAQAVLNGVSRNRWIAFSDDGTNIKNPSEKGICSSNCSASSEVVLDTVNNISIWIQNNPKKARLHHIELLPRSVSEPGSKPSDLWKTLSAESRELMIYLKIGKIWGKNIRRKYPDWMKRKYL